MLNQASIDKFAELNATYVVSQSSGEITRVANNTRGYYVAVPPILMVTGLMGQGTEIPKSVDISVATGLPMLYFGVWNNDERVYPEYSFRVNDRQEAEDFGRRLHQIAIWDIEKDTNIVLY